MHSVYTYILVMAGVSFVIRVLPLTLIRKQITNSFVRSFLYYVPYITLAVMTFPAIYQGTLTPLSGILALVVGILTAWKSGSLFITAVASCLSVFIAELLLV